LTLLLGIGFVWFQVKGYGQLVDKGIHATGSRILVNEGRYGDYYRLKYKGNYLEVDGNHYYLEGKDANAQALEAISTFGAQLTDADQKGGLKDLKGYGTDFVLLYKDEPLTFLNGELMHANGEKVGLLDLQRLASLGMHLKDKRGDFF